MLNDTFVDKVCTIYETWVIMDGATQIPTKNIIYNQIPCDFWKPNVRQNNLWQVESLKTDDEMFEIVLNSEYVLVRAKMYVELFEKPDDNTLVPAWNFIIVNTPDFVKDWNWRIDNIYLWCKQYDGTAN